MNCTNAYTGNNCYYNIRYQNGNATGSTTNTGNKSVGVGSGSFADKGKSTYHPSDSGTTISGFPTGFYWYSNKTSGSDVSVGAMSIELQVWNYSTGSWTTIYSYNTGDFRTWASTKDDNGNESNNSVSYKTMDSSHYPKCVSATFNGPTSVKTTGSPTVALCGWIECCGEEIAVGPIIPAPVHMKVAACIASVNNKGMTNITGS